MQILIRNDKSVLLLDAASEGEERFPTAGKEKEKLHSTYKKKKNPIRYISDKRERGKKIEKRKTVIKKDGGGVDLARRSRLDGREMMKEWRSKTGGGFRLIILRSPRERERESPLSVPLCSPPPPLPPALP